MKRLKAFGKRILERFFGVRSAEPKLKSISIKGLSTSSDQRGPVKVEITRPQIMVRRFEYSDISTIGELTIDGQLIAHTLEDTVRRIKIAEETAIPAGDYRIVLANSPKFGYCPHILEVPHFTDILIHSGNSDKDSKGCLLVGQYNRSQKNWIGQSRVTFKKLMVILEEMNKKEPLWIRISGGISKEDFKKENV